MKVLLWSTGIREQCRSKKNTLLLKDGVVVTTCQFRKPLVSGPSITAPTIKKTVNPDSRWEVTNSRVTIREKGR